MMPVFKNKSYGSYTVYPNEALELLEGNVDALGLHLYLLSKPQQWIPRADDIERAMGFSYKRRRAALRLLESVGLAVLNKDPLAGSSWDIYDLPRGHFCDASVESTVEERPPIVTTEDSYNNTTVTTKASEPQKPFTDFWKEYPNKKGKAMAERKWLKMSEQDREQAIRDVIVRRQCDDQWTRDKGRYIPHASTYLNQEAYQDEWQSATTGSTDVGDFF